MKYKNAGRRSVKILYILHTEGQVRFGSGLQIVSMVIPVFLPNNHISSISTAPLDTVVV